MASVALGVAAPPPPPFFSLPPPAPPPNATIPVRLTFIDSSHPRRIPFHCHTNAARSSFCIASLTCAAAPAAVAAVSASACAAGPARAVTAEEVAVVLTKVQNVYLQITELMRAACVTIGIYFERIMTFIYSLIGLVLPYIEAVTILAVQITVPIALAAEKALQGIGIDVRPAAETLKNVGSVVIEANKQILQSLEPVISSISQSILATDSFLILRAIAALVLVYLLVPPIFSMIVCSVRGYKGDLSALEALDMVMKRNYFLIDVRTDKEKSKAGFPSLPRYVINRLISVPVEGLSVKFKGQLRDYRKAEAEVAAIKISYLKRINKSSKLVILDRFGDVAKSVARSLTRLGIKNAWTVMDGFDGGRGWVQSRLGTASRSTGIAELLLPSKIISEGAKKIFPSPRDVDVSPRSSKLLPGGYDD